VTLVDRGGIGNQASGQNPGGINPMHGSVFPFNFPIEKTLLERWR
jgi:hypothetical protein